MQRLLCQNVSEMARFLGVTRQAIYAWRVVPWRRVSGVARYTGLKPWEIRPDLYPPP